MASASAPVTKDKHENDQMMEILLDSMGQRWMFFSLDVPKVVY
jgi:hypothetical protein